MTTTTKQMRDLCGDCHKLMDAEEMETYEGDRYCPECAAAIREDERAWRNDH